MSDSTANGEEFRDDTRVRRALPPEVLRDPTRIDPVQFEHHLYPAIPHYNLPACHRELRARGILEGAEVRPWLDTVRLVAADRPAGGT